MKTHCIQSIVLAFSDDGHPRSDISWRITRQRKITITNSSTYPYWLTIQIKLSAFNFYLTEAETDRNLCPLITNLSMVDHRRKFTPSNRVINMQTKSIRVDNYVNITCLQVRKCSHTIRPRTFLRT